MCSGHQANILLLDESWSKLNGQAFVVLEVVPLEEKRVVRLIGQVGKHDTNPLV